MLNATLLSEEMLQKMFTVPTVAGIVARTILSAFGVPRRLSGLMPVHAAEPRKRGTPNHADTIVCVTPRTRAVVEDANGTALQNLIGLRDCSLRSE